MKRLLPLLFALAAAILPVRADILANGDFQNGSAHWDGDRKTDTDSPSLTITLKHDTWTKVYQKFHSADSALKVHVAYQFSADCTFLPQNGDAGFFVTDGVIRDITGERLANVMSDPLPIGGFISVVFDPTKPLVFTSLLHGNLSSDPQEAGGFFYDLNPHEEKIFYIAFPPGKGTVTLTHVSLEPAPNGPTRD